VTESAAAPTNGAAAPEAAPSAPGKDLSWSEYIKAHPPDDAAEQPPDDTSQTQSPSPQGADRPAASQSDQPERDEKGRFLPKDEQPAPKKAEPKKAAPPAEPEEPPAEAAGPVSADTLQKARAALAKGDLKSAMKLAFGKAPEDFAINSKQWAAWRHERAKERQKLEQKELRLSQVVGQIKERFAPYVEAEELLDKGDVEAWVRKATRGKYGYNDLAKRALKQFHDEPPAVRELREQNDRLAAELREMREGDQRRAAEYEQAQKEQQAYEYYSGALSGHPDQRIAKLAKRPAFVAKVIERIADHWNVHEEELDPLDTANEVFAEEYGELFDDSPVAGQQAGGGANVLEASGAPISAAQTGAAPTPVRRTARSTSLPLSQAAEVTAPIPERDSPERDAAIAAKYKRMFRNSMLT
jgi:hypothetical protein